MLRLAGIRIISQAVLCLFLGVCSLAADSLEGRQLLKQAEALYSGSGGLYAPDESRPLFERAADTGDPIASFRLASLLKGSSVWEASPGDEERSLVLYERSKERVVRLAAAGDSEAQYLLGFANLIGLGSAPDPEAARGLLEKPAGRGHLWAAHALGWMAETGTGLPTPDPKSAVSWYSKAAERGSVRSMNALAVLLSDKDSPNRDCSKALIWAQHAAQRGFARASFNVASVLYFGVKDCVKPQPKEALPWLEKAAESGWPGAKYNLAFALLVGDTGRRDDKKAIGLLEQEAKGNNVLAMELLSFLKVTGLGVAVNAEEARELRARAAARGSDTFHTWNLECGPGERACNLHRLGLDKARARVKSGDLAAAWILALSYDRGYAVERDPGKALAFARQAAGAGEPEAMRILGYLLKNGDATDRDAVAGVRWWRLCAEAGNSFCMMWLGHSLRDGEGVERDLKESVRWLTRSAEAGNWWSVKELGRLYDLGQGGGSVDLEKAAYWKRKLAVLGSEEERGWMKFHGYSWE